MLSGQKRAVCDCITSLTCFASQGGQDFSSGTLGEGSQGSPH